MKVLGQGFENVLEPQNDDDDADIFSKGAMFRLVKHSFSYLQSQLLTDDVIKKRL